MAKRALVTSETHPLSEPFNIGSFRFTGTGVEVHGRPTYEETQGAFDFVTRAVRCSGFWMVDMIRYIESREDFGDARDALISAETGLTEGSVKVYRSIGKRVPPANRVEGVPFGHHIVVAPLEADEQIEWLEKSKAEGWTGTELRAELHASKRVKILSGSAAGVQHLEVVLHVSVEAPTHTKAAGLAKAEITRLLKSHGGHILEAKVATVRAQ
ncbi:MAG: hypothetical protein Q7R30_11375 [Acidobacteriota bacterium]|nr:hypothetical protein [Acidobacteriota bacterium]